MADMRFSSEKASKPWNIRDIVKQISPVLKDHILLLHAWLGCDTTSAIYDQGKTGLCKKILTSKALQSLFHIIGDPDAEEGDVIDAGIHVFLHMYGGDTNGSLTKLR